MVHVVTVRNRCVSVDQPAYCPKLTVRVVGQTNTSSVTIEYLGVG